MAKKNAGVQIQTLESMSYKLILLDPEMDNEEIARRLELRYEDHYAHGRPSFVFWYPLNPRVPVAIRLNEETLLVFCLFSNVRHSAVSIGIAREV